MEQSRRRMQVDDYIIVSPQSVDFRNERGRIVQIGHGKKALIEFQDKSQFWVYKEFLMPDLVKMAPVLYDDYSKRMKQGIE